MTQLIARQGRLPSEIPAPKSTDLLNDIPASAITTASNRPTVVPTALTFATPPPLETMQSATSALPSSRSRPSSEPSATSSAAASSTPAATASPPAMKYVVVIVPIIAIVLLIPILYLLYRSHQMKRQHRRHQQRASSDSSGPFFKQAPSFTKEASLPYEAAVFRPASSRNNSLPLYTAEEPVRPSNSVGLFDFDLDLTRDPADAPGNNALIVPAAALHPRSTTPIWARSPSEASVAQAVAVRRSQPSVISNPGPGRFSSGQFSHQSRSSTIVDLPPPYANGSLTERPDSETLESPPALMDRLETQTFASRQSVVSSQFSMELVEQPVVRRDHELPELPKQPQFAPLNRIGHHSRSNSRPNLFRSPESTGTSPNLTRPSVDTLRRPSQSTEAILSEIQPSPEHASPLRSPSPGVLPQIYRESLHWEQPIPARKSRIRDTTVTAYSRSSAYSDVSALSEEDIARFTDMIYPHGYGEVPDLPQSPRP